MPEPKPFAGGDVVAITGAAGGIGAALARRFARAGARLGLLDVDLPGAQALADELGKAGVEAAAVACDVTDEAACARAVAAVVERFGGIDVLVNNAGITHLSTVAETEPHVIRRVMDINFFGAAWCTRAALASIRERRGHVIAMSSVAGIGPLYGRCAYAASKHALHGFFDTLRSEEREHGVHVMLVCPSFVRTQIGEHALGGDGGKAEFPRTTTGAQMEPADAADAIFAGLVAGKRLLPLGATGKLSYAISRVAPAFYERMMTRRMRPS